MKLSDMITSSVGAEAPITLLYGGPGVGKTSFVAQGCLILDVEDGAAEIGARRIPRAHLSTWPKFLEVLGALRDEPTGPVAVDSMTAVVELATRAILDEDGSASLADARGGYGRGVDGLEREMRRMLAMLEQIRRPVVLVAHEIVKHVSDPSTGEWDQCQPDLHERVLRVLHAQCSAVLRARLAPIVRPAGKKSTAVEFTDAREVFCIPSKGAVAKNRLGLPPKLPLQWEAFAAAIAPQPTEAVYAACMEAIAGLPEERRADASKFVDAVRADRGKLLAAKGRILELLESKEVTK